MIERESFWSKLQYKNFDAVEQQEYQENASLEREKREKSETKKGKLCENREKPFQAAQVLQLA
jgi:hypothetical protein